MLFLKFCQRKSSILPIESLTLIPKSFLKVLSVIRKEGKEDLFYDIDAEQDQILIKKGQEVLGIVPILKVSSKLAGILEKIKAKSKSKGAFTLPEAVALMQDLRCEKVKSSSSKKTDISLKIQDPNTGIQQTRGFSIKSKIGGLSTLFNASRATNFEYEIVKSDRHENKSLKPLINLKDSLAEGESLQFIGIPNAIFQRNLTMCDSQMPAIMAEMVRAYYLGLGSSVKDLVNYVESQDPLKVVNHKGFYKHKLNEFLLAVAFGMQPSEAMGWNI